MKISVHMTAYSTKSDIREVEIPDEEITPATTIEQALGLAFYYGQNDFQPQKHPSVSMGDVIELKEKYYMVMSVGFKEIDRRAFNGIPDQAALKPNFMKRVMVK